MFISGESFQFRVRIIIRTDLGNNWNTKEKRANSQVSARAMREAARRTLRTITAALSEVTLHGRADSDCCWEPVEDRRPIREWKSSNVLNITKNLDHLHSEHVGKLKKTWTVWRSKPAQSPDQESLCVCVVTVFVFVSCFKDVLKKRLKHHFTGSHARYIRFQSFLFWTC